MGQLSASEQQELLLLARKVIEMKLFGKSHIVTPCSASIFLEKKGAFVTIHKSDSLKGCIGVVEAVTPLKDIIVKMAQSAAFNDPRFTPLTEEEYEAIDIEISVLSAAEKINSSKDIVVGQHGLIISHGFHRGLLLPQVPIEQGWDRETFLSHTCMKAHLPPDMWQKGATIEVFEAEVFGEKDFKN